MSVDALASDDETDDVTDDSGATSDNEDASDSGNANSDDAVNDVNENVNDTDTTTDDENAGASDVAFTDCEEVINLTAENGGVVNLYAVWSPNEARIHYVANRYRYGAVCQSAYKEEEEQKRQRQIKK